MKQSLALKYRPQDFASVIGQEITVQSLGNALTERRLHPAYLFAGPRGVGKTSLARIFAKALNCEQGPTRQPCNQCTACREITQGRSLSVLEIDGASNTSVDDVRLLRENAQYLPPGKFKIYIIDEVHMLSTAAFNALLKTLEEPPAHVLFLFATTDPQKVPTTVLSRVIRFDLQALPLAKIVEHLKTIAGEEKIEVEEAGLYQIAREATGGLRDALSLLDQILSYGGGIKASSVAQVLGLSPRHVIHGLAVAILAGEPHEALKQARKATESGIDLRRLGRDLLEHFRHLMVLQVSSDPLLFDLPPSELEILTKESQGVPLQRLDQIFQILQKGLLDLTRAPVPHLVWDVLILRLCRHRELKLLEEILQDLGRGSPLPRPVPSGTGPRPAPAQTTAAAQHPVAPTAPYSHSWGDFVKRLEGQKPQIASILSHGRLVEMIGQEIHLAFPPQSIYLEMINDNDRRHDIEQQMESFFGSRRTLICRQEDGAKAPPKQGSIVHEAISIFRPTTTKVVGKGAP